MAQNWPAVVVEADFSTGPPNQPGTSRVSLESNGIAIQELSTQRGAQYELGHAEAGTCTLKASDPNEILNPLNTSSPWNAGNGGNNLVPYRAVQAVAWWNSTTNTSTTGNLLNSTNTVDGTSTPFDPSFESGTSGWTNNGTAATVAQSTTQAFNGTHSLAVTVTKAADSAVCGMTTLAGYQQTLSLYVYAPTGATVTATFLNAGAGTTIASASTTTTGAWQRLTLTGTPTNASTEVKVTASGTYTLTFYVDALQLELGASASAFTTTGPTRNPLFTGFIERYPSTWVDAGFRAIRPLVAVDALSVLSRTVVNQSYSQTINADGPMAYIPWSDSSGPQQVQMPTGGQHYLGYTQIGTQSSSVNFGGDSFLDGSKAVSVVQQNTNPVTTGDNTMVTYVGTRQGLLAMNTGAFTLEIWVKFSAGVVYFGVADGESTVNQAGGPSQYIGWYTSGGELTIHYTDPNGNSSANWKIGSGNFHGYPDGQWHYLGIVIPGSGSNTFRAVTDNSWGGSVSLVQSGSPSPSVGLVNFFLSATAQYGDPVSSLSAANMAVYPKALTQAQMLAHYNRGVGYINEWPGNRATRLLQQYWSATLFRSKTGYVALSPDFNYNGRTVLDCLNEIADTEGGRVYADASGIVAFESRGSRYYNQATIGAVFGENTAGGEIPYETVEYDFDPTYVFSQANLTRPGNSNYPPQVNTASQTLYGQRILSQQLMVNTDYDLSQAAAFYLQRYSNATMRVKRLTINPASNPVAFGKVLGLDLGTRVTVKRRTSAGIVISGDLYVEQISHHVDTSATNWTVDLQLSPVFVPRAFILSDPTYGVLGTSAGNAVIY